MNSTKDSTTSSNDLESPPKAPAPSSYFEQRRMVRVFRFVWLMRFLGLFYVAFAVFLFLFPNELFYLINVGPKVFKVTEAIPDPVEKFFVVFAAAHFGMLAAISWYSAAYPLLRGYVVVHLIGKIISCYGFVYLFMNEQRYFAYATGAGIEVVTGILVLITAAMVRSQSFAGAGNS
jgi:hypothetical protein